jgi:hypothetical protein
MSDTERDLDIIFACCADSPATVANALLLIDSIRTFAARFSGAPAWVLVPRTLQLPDPLATGLSRLGASLVQFTPEASVRSLPFSTKAIASAAAESAAAGAAKLLCFMDPDSLILQEPLPFVLGPDKVFGCRPVDLKLIGSPWGEPPDDLWQLVYMHCHVEEARIYRVVSSVDRQAIRAYFNACLLIARPERGVFRAWRANLLRMAQDGELLSSVAQQPLRRVFLHQMALAGTVLSLVSRTEVQELPAYVNYPLHLHERYPAEHRPAWLNDLISCRYEQVFETTSWEASVPVAEPLRSWLIGRVKPPSPGE